jgi:hypothetical protein
MGYAEHDDGTDVEATRAFLAFGQVYPDVSAYAATHAAQPACVSPAPGR